MSNILGLVGKMLLVILALLLFAAIGAISFGIFAVVIPGGLYLLGFISQGTAQALALWIAAIGALWGMVMGTAAAVT